LKTYKFIRGKVPTHRVNQLKDIRNQKERDELTDSFWSAFISSFPVFANSRDYFEKRLPRGDPGSL
jgi:hypothetical protein